MKPKFSVPLTAYLLLLPALVLMAVFTFYPVLYGSYLGFTEYTAANLGSNTPPKWVGLDNFRTVISDELFRIGLLNSLKYLIIVPILQIASLAVAVLVNRQIPGIALFRAAYYVPVITSITLAAVMWDWVFTREGLLNYVLEFFKVIDPDGSFGWLLNPNTALWAIMLVTFWRGFGYYMVLYLGGLQSIPLELTVPLMRPTILLCSLLSSLAAIRVLEEILVFTNGGPLNSTYTVLMYVYQKSFGLDFNYGVASAAGLLLAVVGFVLSYINFRITREDAPKREAKA
jgi:putative chitobiose transport system permease protein